MNTQKLQLNLLAVFLFSAAVILLFYLGLPVDFNADYLQTHIRATSISNSKLLNYIVNPIGPVWFYPEDGRMEYVRPLQVLLFNLVHHRFPFTVVPFHYLAAIGMGLLSVVFFLLIYYYTQSFLLGWLAVLLYSSFPSNYFIMSSVCPIDFQFYLSMVTISTFLIFGFLTSGWAKTKMNFTVGILTWFFLVWIAIKLKSTEKIIPFICFSFLILRLKFTLRKIGKTKVAILALVLFCSLILVVPIRSFKIWSHNPYFGTEEKKIAQPVTKKDKVTFSFQWKNMVERTFFVPGGEFPFLSPVRHKTPRSFSENYGFFMAWIFWASILIVPFILMRSNKRNSFYNTELFKHFYWLLLTWFGVTIAGFANGIDLSEIRLLNFAYVPSILLLFISIGIIENYFFPENLKKMFRVMLTILVAYTVLSNFSLLTKLVGHFGGMQDTLVRVENDMFQSFFKKSPEGAELYEKHQELESRAVFVDWYDHEDDWFRHTERKIEQEHVLYFLSRNQEPERLQKFRDAGYQVKLFNTYSFFDSKPLIFRFLYQAAKRKEKLRGRPMKQEIVVYVITKK